MYYITKRIGIDDFIVGRISGSSIESNDSELTAVAKELVGCKTFKKVGNQKFPVSENEQVLVNVKNKISFPFNLTESGETQLELYREVIA